MKRECYYIIGLLFLVLSVCWFTMPAISDDTRQWYDNENQFKSDDPKINVRRSEHFRIIWGKGVGEDGAGVNADFPRVTEQLVQGNLQMLEQCWHRYHDPIPKGMGFHIPGESLDPSKRDGKLYRANLIMNNTGIWEGGAWGSSDPIGLPLFALPPTYLSFDPPSGATPHEYGHTVFVNAGGFNDTPYDGMWHEASANWIMLQFNNNYPGPGGVGVQPYLSAPHGRNYYDCWQLFEYFRENPKYGYSFINKLWTQANGSKSKGAEYIFDAMARLDPSGSLDSYNAIKDALGNTAAKSVTWDFERGQFFRKQSPRTMDPFTDMYRRAYTELVRRNGSTTWFRVPFAHAPMQGGYNIVPIALPDKKGGGYKVSVNFKPLWDPIRRSDWRATLVAVNDNGEPRYSTMWNGGINSITLSADENQLFLVVSATPDFMPFEGFSHPLPSDLPLQPQAYEISFVNTKATAYETRYPIPKGVTGKRHTNGGGFVADTAKVDPTAYVGPNAMVLDNAKVLGNARIGDYAVVMGNAIVKDNARVSGHALVKDNAQVYGNGKVRDWATVGGNWKVYENGRAIERCFLLDRGELHGNATIKGNVPDYGGAKVSGYAIKEGDCANSANIDHQVLMCWVWGIDQNYADSRPDTGGLYCNYTFERESTIYALDTFGLVHGYLMGNPKTFDTKENIHGTALQLNGKNQYVELKRDVFDFKDTTIAVWVKWAGGPADQRIINWGDGKLKYAYLTPKDAATGKVKFVISNNGKSAEQSLTGTSSLPIDKWTHIAVTLNGDTGTLYIDGKPVATNTKMTLDPDMVLAENSLAGIDYTFIGRGVKGNYFAGLIDDFRVYVMPQDASVIDKLASGQIKQLKTVDGISNYTYNATPKLTTPKFLQPPTVAGDSAVMMSATRPTEKNVWLEYYFRCVSGKGHDSGWISSNRWTDCDLAPGTYSYTVKMRDKTGKTTAESASMSVTIPKDTNPPSPAEFALGPIGISNSAIRMTAKKAIDASALVEYKFVRSDGKTSGWQSSPTWTDTGLTEGSRYSYTVQVRDSKGNIANVSAAKSAVARDDTPPARYVKGEWQTLPYATVNNSIAMRALSVSDINKEDKEVEYYFHCTTGNAPDSGWQSSPFYETPPLPDGTYSFEFKIRDKSPQLNETPYSSVESATVSITSGYHNYAMSQLANLPEGALVSVKGKVTGVEKNHYLVSGDGVTLKVVPATKGDETDPSLNGKEVTVNGCWWTVSGEKRITWAELK
jgi:hypothetical protein